MPPPFHYQAGTANHIDRQLSTLSIQSWSCLMERKALRLISAGSLPYDQAVTANPQTPQKLQVQRSVVLPEPHPPRTRTSLRYHVLLMAFMALTSVDTRFHRCRVVVCKVNPFHSPGLPSTHNKKTILPNLVTSVAALGPKMGPKIG